MEKIKHLNWRYATKRYNNSKIEVDHLNAILESIRLAPTSLGLQPFKVFVIDSDEQREKLFPAANNQAQIKEASHILLFAANTSITPDSIQQYMENVAQTRSMPIENLEGFRKMIDGYVSSVPTQNIFHWNAHQVYIALGFAMATAAQLGVDTTPMEGIKAAEIDQLYNLPEQNLKATVLLALGHRDAENDRLAALPKVRKSSEEMFEFL